jgi:hypothetical protein
MVLLFSGAHLARMTFHPFLAAHTSAKMQFTSTGSTRSADTFLGNLDRLDRLPGDTNHNSR